MSLDFRNIKKLTIGGVSLKSLAINGVQVWKSFTNQIPISTDTDGSIYNKTGYMVGKRINSSGAVANVDNPSAAKAPFVTGFIPCKQGDVIRLKNCYIPAVNTAVWGDASANTNVFGGGFWGLRSGLYSSAKAKVNVFSWGTFQDGDTKIVSGYSAVNNRYTQFTIAQGSIKYIRLTLATDTSPADAIVTVNEEIT